MTNVVRLHPDKMGMAQLLVEELDAQANASPLLSVSTGNSPPTTLPMPTASQMHAVNSAALCALVGSSLNLCGEHVLALLHSLDKAKNSVSDILSEIQDTTGPRPEIRLIDGVKVQRRLRVPISSPSSRQLADVADSMDVSIRQLLLDISNTMALLHQLRMMQERGR